MSAIKVYERNTVEYAKLKFFADRVNHRVSHEYWMTIETIYFDYGSNWKYSAPIIERFKDDSSWQALNPREYEELINCDSFNKIDDMALEYADKLLR